LKEISSAPPTQQAKGWLVALQFVPYNNNNNNNNLFLRSRLSQHTKDGREFVLIHI